MNKIRANGIGDAWILSERGRKNVLDPMLPYGWMVEKERTLSGAVEDTGIIFLTNRECPFHCLMCDLWKNTTDERVPDGAIPAQIAYALERMIPVKHIKLYNSGSFFDRNAIPPEDYDAIASLLSPFETVIVESHPRFINEKVPVFRDMLKPRLEVAMGLETVHREILARLNKRMTKEDFENASHFLHDNNIRTRAFILLRPPFMSEQEGIYWAKKSVDFAFNAGVGCCTVIPVRSGNGVMESLAEEGLYQPPAIRSLEEVLEYGILLNQGRVFADTWDLKLFSDCDECFQMRLDRIHEMNLKQEILSAIQCSCHASTLSS